MKSFPGIWISFPQNHNLSPHDSNPFPLNRSLEMLLSLNEAVFKMKKILRVNFFFA